MANRVWDYIAYGLGTAADWTVSASSDFLTQVWGLVAWFPEPATLITLSAVAMLRLRGAKASLGPVRRARRAKAMRRIAQASGGQRSARSLVVLVRYGCEILRFRLSRHQRMGKLAGKLSDSAIRERRISRRLLGVLIESDRGERLDTVLLANYLLSRPGTKSPDSCPSDDEPWVPFAASSSPDRESDFTVALAMIHLALEPRSSTFTATYVLPERWAEHRSQLVLLERYLSQFDGLLVSFAKPLEGDQTFAEAASAASGALVLADLTTANSGCVERFAVWHSDKWQGREYKSEGNPFRSPYANRVASRGAPKVAGIVGMYNGRIPTLRGVQVRQREGSDGAILVLSTGETDYNSTELCHPDDAGRADYDDGINCKKLVPERSDDHLPVFKRREPQSFKVFDKEARRARDRAFRPIGATECSSPDEPRRGVLLNGKVGLVATSGEENELILMQRTTRTFNAVGTLGPTSGGVIELPVLGDRRDADEFGAVDFMRGIRREVNEELGLTPDDYNLSAQCVFLSNNRPRPRARADTGEMVATVLAMGTTPLSREEIRKKRYQGSPSKGLYESVGLVFVPMGQTASEFLETVQTGSYSKNGLNWLQDTQSSAGALRLVDEIEQPTLLTIIYASAMIHGVKETMQCFGSVVPTPWWTQPWPEGDPGTLSRICRDPTQLLPQEPEAFATWVSQMFGSAGRRRDYENFHLDASDQP